MDGSYRNNSEQYRWQKCDRAPLPSRFRGDPREHLEHVRAPGARDVGVGLLAPASLYGAAQSRARDYIIFCDFLGLIINCIVFSCWGELRARRFLRARPVSATGARTRDRRLAAPAPRRALRRG